MHSLPSKATYPYMPSAMLISQKCPPTREPNYRNYCAEPVEQQALPLKHLMDTRIIAQRIRAQMSTRFCEAGLWPIELGGRPAFSVSVVICSALDDCVFHGRVEHHHDGRSFYGLVGCIEYVSHHLETHRGYVRFPCGALDFSAPSGPCIAYSRTEYRQGSENHSCIKISTWRVRHQILDYVLGRESLTWTKRAGLKRARCRHANWCYIFTWRKNTASANEMIF